MQPASKPVNANKAATGVDGLDIALTGACLDHVWPAVQRQLVNGIYRPQTVSCVVIPKPDGGERELGICIVTGRLV